MRIALSGNRFTRISTGFHVFYIYDVKYDETFGQMDISLYSETTKETHKERYFFLSKNGGEPNEKAISAFSYLAWVAMNDFDAEDVDPVELIGKRFTATVDHDEVQDANGQTKTYVRLNNKAAYADESRAFPWEDSELAANYKKAETKAEPAKAETKAETKAEPAKTEESSDDLLSMFGL